MVFMKIIKNDSSKWQSKLYVVIFESNTFYGKLFDIILILVISLSVLVVMLESVESVRIKQGELLRNLEWLLTILFTIEYFLRLISVKRRKSYVFSFFGIIDFLAIAPTYISVLIPGAQFLLIIRVLRLLRIFRILKLMQFMSQANILLRALQASRYKISVFIFAVLTLVIVIGALMYVVEGPEHGYSSIPKGIYWAIVTLTTVGYGDMSPQTNLGQVFASLVMIIGFAIIAVPTGIVTVELSNAQQRIISQRSCVYCSRKGHDLDANNCKYCGEKLEVNENETSY